MQGALSLAHGAIIQAEALRLALVRAGVHYRALFAWLAVTVRRTSGEELNGCRNAFQTDAAALSDFIHSQLLRDAIGPQLTQTVRCKLLLGSVQRHAARSLYLVWVDKECLCCCSCISLQKPVSWNQGRLMLQSFFPSPCRGLQRGVALCKRAGCSRLPCDALARSGRRAEDGRTSTFCSNALAYFLKRFQQAAQRFPAVTV